MSWTLSTHIKIINPVYCAVSRYRMAKLLPILRLAPFPPLPTRSKDVATADRSNSLLSPLKGLCTVPLLPISFPQNWTLSHSRHTNVTQIQWGFLTLSPPLCLPVVFASGCVLYTVCVPWPLLDFKLQETRRFRL